MSVTPWRRMRSEKRSIDRRIGPRTHGSRLTPSLSPFYIGGPCIPGKRSEMDPLPPCCLRRGSARHVVVPQFASRRRHAVAPRWSSSRRSRWVPVASSSSGGAGGSAATGSIAAPGLYGKLPPAGTPTQGGTITYGQLNGQTPNYIFPITPSGNASTYNYQWQQMMYLPLYNNQAYGSSPGINYGLSLANEARVQRWRQDRHDPAEAGLQVEQRRARRRPGPAVRRRADQGRGRRERRQLGLVHAGLLPSEPGERQRDAVQYTVVMHLKRAFNPGFFLNDQLALEPLPASQPSLERRLGGRTAPELERPGQREEDLRLPRQGGRTGRDFGTNPLWKIADGPFVLSSFSPVTASWTAEGNPSYGGSPKPYSTPSRASRTPGSRRC